MPTPSPLSRIQIALWIATGCLALFTLPVVQHGELNSGPPAAAKLTTVLGHLANAMPQEHGPVSMLSPQRLRNVRTLTELTLHDKIPGNYIETGVWRGGACILMRAVLAAYDVGDRKVFCADSFEGLPKPNAEKYRADRRDRLFAFEELAVSEEQVRQNFARYDLLDDQVVFLKGWFKDTLPKLGSERFALIRLDGDMYESTMDALTNLYDRLSERGFVIIDDYGGLKNCRQAVHDFLDSRGLKPEIRQVDDTGVWWRKQA